ncbi:hypothetical protein GCM10025781_05250 [Kocuria gwangalliensis]|uniref:beta-glucosidase n=1 Tax=Kocuria gwangalliensis TaxID=501592 RepID=A0ABP8WKE3_9MICC
MTTQPELGSTTGSYIVQDGLTFRDLDGDDMLSPFEDWRLPATERARDLVSRMTTEEKAGLMIIGSHYPGYSAFLPHPVKGQILNQEDVWRDANPITGVPFAEPVLVTSATDKAINVRGQRDFVVRDNLTPHELAEWTNAVQELAENSRLGIPAIFASNPRNHVALVSQFGVNESTGIFSEWPGELGLAALNNPELIEKFGREIAKEWRAGGIHKLYGYMADLASEPRWSRFNGTFGEDPELVSDYIGAVVRGLQGETLSDESVATTIKHFPGGGVRLDGHDPHFEWGQTNEYPTENALERYHLPPFQAALNAGAASIMPYYARPMNNSAPQLTRDLWQEPTTQFEEVAFAYNRTFIQQLLREKMGHAGYVNSDSGVIDAMMWGVEELSEAERFAAAVHAGTDIFSDMANPAQLIAAVERGHLAASDLDQPVARLLTEIFSLGLFENPYVSADHAIEVIGAPEVSALGERAQRRSVTLLRNDADAALVPLQQGLSPGHGPHQNRAGAGSTGGGHCVGLADCRDRRRTRGCGLRPHLGSSRDRPLRRRPRRRLTVPGSPRQRRGRGPRAGDREDRPHTAGGQCDQPVAAGRARTRRPRRGHHVRNQTRAPAALAVRGGRWSGRSTSHGHAGVRSSHRRFTARRAREVPG